MGLKEMRFCGMDWIDLDQNKDQWMALLHFKEISGSVKCWQVLEWLHNWGLCSLKLDYIVTYLL
jgi:hypothetical protein